MDFNPVDFLHTLRSDLKLDEASFLTSDMDVRTAARHSLLASVLKKYVPKTASADLDRLAKDGFLASNAKCVLEFVPPNSYYGDIIKDAKRELESIFHSGDYQSNVLTLDDCLNNGRTGPGKSHGVRETDFFFKMFSSQLTVTDPGLYQHYVGGLSDTWREAELIRLSRYGLKVIKGSKLASAPKSAETNRSICTEPSLNMFYQQGARHVLEKLLRQFYNIDLSVQPTRNQWMARSGSIDGRFSTIDLKDASNTISTGLVAYLLPRVPYGVLDILRSKYTLDEDWVSLRMFASMGNAFTFPLQTLIFAALVRASYRAMGITPLQDSDRNYSVFGDDIICLHEAFSVVSRVLEECGFIVNSLKSFDVGPFRESCGRDYFKGADVRGIYLKEIYDETHIYSAFNRLVRWSLRHNIDISRTLLYLKGLARFQPVPFDAADSEGFKIPRSFLLSPKLDRNGAVRYRASVSELYRVRCKRELDINPSGTLIACVGGYILGASVVRRSDRLRIKIVRRKTSSWDFLPHVGLCIRDYEQLFLGLTLMSL